MQPARVTRSSVLGKRSHQAESSRCEQSVNIPTPDSTPNPKRPRVSTSLLDGDHNKENVPPFSADLVGSPSRSLRRTSTELSTPSRSRDAVRRTVSVSNIVPTTPTTAISNMVLSTPPPTPHSSLLPIHARVRAMLRATCNGTALIAGRDQERGIISDFVTSLSQGTSEYTTLYISGSPGTGKTALVNDVLQSFDAEFKIVSVNCMALNTADALWDRIVEELDSGEPKKAGGKPKKMKGKETVEALLPSLQTKCILVLDELDHIAVSLPALSSLFSLPQTHSSTLRVIGIANTHTLTSSLSHFSAHGANGVQTLHFAPYTPSQLLEIVNSRLAPLTTDDVVSKQLRNFLPPPPLLLLTKKVAAQTGDVRSLFEVLRGAIDACLSASRSATSNESNPLDTPSPTVSPSHVLGALKAHAPATANTRSAPSTSAPGTVTGNSEIVMKVRALGLHARLVLLSILLASKRLEAGFMLSSPSPSTTSTPKSPMKRASSAGVGSSPSSGIDTAHLHAYYTSMLTRGDCAVFSPVSRGEMSDLLGVLETNGLISLSSSLGLLASPSKTGRRAFGRSASFGGTSSKMKIQEVALADGMRCDEVLRGLGISSDREPVTSVGIQEEEVRAIWEKEKARLTREVKATARASPSKPNASFEDAVED